MDQQSALNQPLKASHGETWTVEHFQLKYNLNAGEAERLFQKFGPYSVDLDVIMRAKRQKDLITSAKALSIDF